MSLIMSDHDDFFPTKITLCGPPAAEEILETIANEMARDGSDAVLFHGPFSGLIASPRWNETDILVGIHVHCGAQEMDLAPGLRGIVSPIIGYDGLDVPAATARDILVLNGVTPENANSMAEATIMLLLASLYNLPSRQAQLRHSEARAAQPVRSHMLMGRTIGIIGFGNIARGVVDRLGPWGVRLLVHTRTKINSAPPCLTFVTLEELLSESDAVLVLADLNASSYHLLDDRRLGLMKPGSIIVNTSRGGLIEEAALLRHIGPGGIACFALDVFETEPLPADSPLREVPEAILTGHNVGHSAEALNAIPRTACENILALLGRRSLQNVVNPDAVESWRRRWLAVHQ